MNVLHVISSGGMYGAEAVILTLSRTINQSDGSRSSLAAFTGPGQLNRELFAAAQRDGVESHPIPCLGPIDRSVPAALRALVRSVGAQIVHAHGYKADLYAHFALRGAGIPLVSTCHTWYDNDRSVRLYGALDRWVLRRFDGVVAVSEEVRQRLLHAGVKPQRIRLIRNGIALPPLPIRSTEPADSLHVGLVGRLAPEKGIDLFIRAAARVLAELPETRFSVAGDGPSRAELERLIAELRIGSHVALPGRREDMPAFYASLDLLVSASRQEGLPIALLEGMAAGLPIVATAVGAVPDLVQQGINGSLVPAGDVEALARAILDLLRKPELRQQLGAAARKRIAADFSATRMTADYLQLYRDVLIQAVKRETTR